MRRTGPFRGLRRRTGDGRRGARRRPLAAGLVWGGLFVGAVVLAAYGDDARSALRAMRADCRVTTVTDGDTVKLFCRGIGQFDARIVGYDAPELSAPACEAEREAAVAARRHLAGLTRDAGAFVGDAGSLEVALLGRDRYGRRLVDLRIDGRRVATRMVAAGHGRRYLGGRRAGWCSGAGDA